MLASHRSYLSIFFQICGFHLLTFWPIDIPLKDVRKIDIWPNGEVLKKRGGGSLYFHFLHFHGVKFQELKQNLFNKAHTVFKLLHSV
jgi:hypothetical protein